MIPTIDRHDYATLGEHLEDLRKTLLKILFTIACGTALGFLFYKPLLSFLIKPLDFVSENATLLEERLEFFRITNRQRIPVLYTPTDFVEHPFEISPGVQQVSSTSYLIPPDAWISFAKPSQPHPLVILSPLEGMGIAFKTSFWLGIILSSPFWLLTIFQFISPGLRFREKKLIFSFLFTSLVFIFAGCCFAFKITIPIANAFLWTFNESIASNFWSLALYLDYTLFLFIANGLAFELCAIGLFAVRQKLITVHQLTSYRRFAILASFIIGALLTPPDILTQFLLAIPLICFYEMIILYARMRQENFKLN